MFARHVCWKGLCLLGLAVTLAGCNRDTPVTPPPPLEVVVSQAQPPKSKPETVLDWDSYTGTIDAKDSVEIRSRVRGHIKKVKFTEGDEIPAGEELFLIDAEPFQADLKKYQGELTAWEAKLKAAEEDVAIKKPLAEKGTVSKAELFEALGKKGDALGGIETSKGKILEAQLNIGYCKISAPIAGKIGEAALTEGDLVNASGADSLLTTIIAVDPMFVYFNVNQKAYDRYRDYLLERAKKDPAAAAKGRPKVPVELLVGSRTHKGIVDFVDNRVDPNTSSIKVRARFDNPKGEDGNRPLTAGSFARIRVTIGEPVQAMLVTDRAILTDQNLKYVLVVNREKKNVVERVDVKVSERLQPDGRRAVEGLKGDEWIIVEGVNRVRPGVTVNPSEKAMPRLPKS